MTPALKYRINYLVENFPDRLLDKEKFLLSSEKEFLKADIALQTGSSTYINGDEYKKAYHAVYILTHASKMSKAYKLNQQRIKSIQPEIMLDGLNDVRIDLVKESNNLQQKVISAKIFDKPEGKLRILLWELEQSKAGILPKDFETFSDTEKATHINTETIEAMAIAELAQRRLTGLHHDHLKKFGKNASMVQATEKSLIAKALEISLTNQ